MIYCVLTLVTLLHAFSHTVTGESFVDTCDGKNLSQQVHIKALLEIYDTHLCHKKDNLSTFGINLALAVEYVLEKVNNNHTDLAVPGIEYALEVDALCYNKSFALKTAFGGLTDRIWTDESICPVSGTTDKVVLGFVGPAYSSNIILMGKYLNNTNIPLVTPSATLTEYSNRSLYYTLFRTTLSDYWQAEAIIALVEKLGWSYMMLVHSDDDYGEQGAKSIRDIAKSRGICISPQEIPIESGQNNEYYSNITDTIIEHDAAGVILIGHFREADEIIEEFRYKSPNKNKYMIASDGVGVDLHLPKGLPRNLHVATISLFYASAQLNGFLSYKRNRPLRNGTTIDDILHQYDQHCRSNGQEYSQCKERLFNSTEATRNTIEATVALLWSFKKARSIVCQSEPGICKELRNSRLFYQLMIDQLYSTSVNTTVDDIPLSFGFDENGETDKPGNTRAYTLNIFHNQQFSQVGDFSPEEKWSITNQNLFDNFGEELRCKTNCDECKTKAPPYLYRKRQSKYIIAGSGAISKVDNLGRCGDEVDVAGFERMESFYYAVDLLVNKTGIDFSTLFIDTCYAMLHTHSILNDIFLNASHARLILPNGIIERIPVSNIVLFIGDHSSGISLVLQSYLGIYEIPQVSYASSSPWLSNRLRYPYFMRNVPSDEQQVTAMMKVIKHLGIKQIGLIYQSDSPSYGIIGKELVIEKAKEYNICISYIDSVEDTIDSIRNAVSSLQDEGSSLPRCLVLFSHGYMTEKLIGRIAALDGAQWSERGNFFIGTDSWGTRNSIIEGKENVIKGSLTFSFSDKCMKWTNNSENFFKNYVRSQTPENNRDNVLFRKFWQDTFSCYLPLDYLSASSTPCDLRCRLDGSGGDKCKLPSLLRYDDSYGKHIVMAALSLAYTIREAQYMEKRCDPTGDCNELFDQEVNRKWLWERMKKVQIPTDVWSEHRRNVPFDENGDGKANYIVNNVVEYQTDKYMYREVFSIEGGIVKETGDPLFYQGKRSDKKLDGFCNTCKCLEGTEPRASDITAKRHSDPTNGNITNWVIPLFFIVLLSLIMIIALLIFVCHLRRRLKLQTKHLKGEVYEVPSTPSNSQAGQRRNGSLQSSSVPRVLPPIPNHLPKPEDNKHDCPAETCSTYTLEIPYLLSAPNPTSRDDSKQLMCTNEITQPLTLSCSTVEDQQENLDGILISGISNSNKHDSSTRHQGVH